MVRDAVGGEWPAFQTIEKSFKENTFSLCPGFKGGDKTNVINLSKNIYHCYFFDRLYAKKDIEMTKKYGNHSRAN